MGNPTAPTPEDASPPAQSGVSPDLVRSYRWQLTPGEDVIETATWAGSIPRVNGVAPRVRVGRSRWFNLLWLLPIGFALLIVAVAIAKGLRSEPAVQRFIVRYPGTVEPSHADVSSGFPVWLRLQHFFNLFLLIFIVRAGVQILSDHPRLYWTRHSTPGRDWFASRTRCLPIRSGRRSRTRSASPSRSACRGFAIRSASRAGGTSASTRSGC